MAHYWPQIATIVLLSANSAIAITKDTRVAAYNIGGNVILIVLMALGGFFA